MKKPFERVAILGLGLIGSSLARALTQHKLAQHIAAFDISESNLRYARDNGFIHSPHAHAGQAVHEADLVVLATPPSTFAALAKDMAPLLKKTAIVTDMGSTKRSAIHAIAPYIASPELYVPSHPIAGSEKTGPEAGNANLFKGKYIILTPAEEHVLSNPVLQLRSLWESVGAKVECMPAELHDRIYAYVSHLPQMAAFASKSAMKDFPKPAHEMFTRFARLGNSNAALWADICINNADYIGEALDEFLTFAGQMNGELMESAEAEPTADDPQAAIILFPKIVSVCLVAAATLLQEQTGVHPARYAGGGFADMTAPAVSDPDTALAAISAHHSSIRKMLQIFLGRMHDIKNAVEKKDAARLQQLFA